MLSPTMRITGAAACAKTTEQKSAAASAVKERRTDRNEDDEFMSTCHCRGAFRGAQRRVAEYNAPPPDRSARHFRGALSTCGACVDYSAAPTAREPNCRSCSFIMTEPVIRAQDLSKIVQSGDAPLTILDGVSFEVGAGATVAIDGASGAEVVDVMFRLNRERGTTLLLVTHNAELASRCARRLSLASGKLIGDDAVRESP